MSDRANGQVPIASESDIAIVRRIVREIATLMGFGVTDVTRIVTAASELTRNIYLYAGSGIMNWQIINTSTSTGIELRFEDRGPGIRDVEQAMEPGYSTGGGLGLGLPGAKRLMDDIQVRSIVGEGTTVIIRKWQGRAPIKDVTHG